MDALNYIAIAMAAIAFTWVGYFLGNFFPTFGKAKRLQIERKDVGQKLLDVTEIKERAARAGSSVDFSFFKRAWKKSIDWLLEREEEQQEIREEPQLTAQNQADHPESENGPAATGAPQEDSGKTVQQLVRVPASLDIPEDAIFLWHDRHRKKVFAQVEKDILDLDQEMSKDQHGALSMLLVDLQEKVGLSATLKAAISEGTDLAYAEKEKQIKQASIPVEEPVKPPSLNPVKSFINYVKADVPKLEDNLDSIPTQINSILQDLIRETPLRDRGISVADWPSRGVVFIVGIDTYDDIEQIPDPNIQKVIKLAVKRWEQSQEQD